MGPFRLRLPNREDPPVVTSKSKDFQPRLLRLIERRRLP